MIGITLPRLSVLGRWAGITISLALMSSSQVATAGFSFCTAPRAPSFFGSKPDKPYCAQTKSCTQTDVDRYRRDVEDHIDHLKAYLRDVDHYSDAAYAYAKCMADLD